MTNGTREQIQKVTKNKTNNKIQAKSFDLFEVKKVIMMK